jgi:uncharacterized protein YndB with AHSA1/START domain
MEYDWSSFTRRINIKATVEDVYAMWVRKTGMEKWFLRKCDFTEENSEPILAESAVQEGNLFTWYWHGWGDDVKEKGAILNTNGINTLAFTFGQEGAEGMICRVSIYEELGETICEIIQENIPVDERGRTHYHIGCMTGWSFYLVNMKSILEGGIDLRNKNDQIKRVVNS